MTIQNLDTVLDQDDQEKVKGGTAAEQRLNTQIPIYCKPKP